MEHFEGRQTSPGVLGRDGHGAEEGGRRVEGVDGVTPDLLDMALDVAASRAAAQEEGAAEQQRGQDLENPEIEGVRQALEHPRALSETEGFPAPEEERHQVVMRDGNAFGGTGRAGGEDHIDDPVSPVSPTMSRRAERFPRLQGAPAVDAESPAFGCRIEVAVHADQVRHRRASAGDIQRQVEMPAIGGEDFEAAIGDHADKPLGGGLRVQGHEAGARLENPQHPHQQRMSRLDHEAGQAVAAHVEIEQEAPQPAGPLVEQPVGHGFVLADGGDLSGSPGRLAGEEPVNQGRCRRLAVRRAPLPKDCLALHFAEERQLGDQTIWAIKASPCGHPGEQAVEVAEHPRSGRLVEQAGVPLQEHREAAGKVGRHERQVELHRGRRERERLQHQPPEVELDVRLGHGEGRERRERRHRGLLERQHGRDQRRPARIALGLEPLDEQGEGEVLVRQRVEHRAPRSRHQLPDIRVPRQAGAQGHRVDEVAHHVSPLAGGTAGHGGAGEELLLAAPAGEHGLPGGEQGDERRAAVGGSEPVDRLRPLRRRGEAPRRVCTGCRGRSVGRSSCGVSARRSCQCSHSRSPAGLARNRSCQRVKSV
jgi:hypothetical protein